MRLICGNQLVLAAAIFLSLPSHGAAQQQPTDFSKLFDKSEVMIAARDGVKLHTEIYSPKGASEPLPIILERTPYGLGDDDKGYSRMLRRYAELIPDGYIFAFQDIRGRYGSEGKFVMQRPVRDPKDPKAIDEGTDTYDTIDWLVKNVPQNNGRVGLLGISYGGWLTVMGMLEPHPALKAVSEQASPADMFLGDDFHHNGAFRLSYPQKYPQDWKLSGYQLMIADEVFRGRFRNSFEKPEAMTPGAVTPFTIDLHTADHVFKKGHRIMVQVQSTWFPVIDRNPQKYVLNIFEAKEGDYQKATHRVYRSKRLPSSVEISVVPSPGVATN